MHLSCAHCFETLHDPTTLPCGWSVCAACVRRRSDALFDAVCESERRPASLAAQLAPFPCPVRACRARHFGAVAPDWRVASIAARIRLAAIQHSVRELALATAAGLDEVVQSQPAASRAGDRLRDVDRTVTRRFEDGEEARTVQALWLVRARARCLRADFDAAMDDAAHAHALNPWNRMGLAARRIIELRRAAHDEAVCVAAERDADPRFARVAFEPFLWSPASQCANAASVPDSPSDDDRIDLECHLCLFPLSDPVTVACGHTACRSCLLTALDRAPLTQSCPVCRFPLPPYASLASKPANRFLSMLIAKWAEHLPPRDEPGASTVKVAEAATVTSQSVSEQMEQPSVETLSYEAPPPIEPHSTIPPSTDSHSTSFTWQSATAPPTHQQTFTIPVFPVTLAYPGTRQEFHIYESRYRVMVKECIDNGTPFGLCLPKRVSLFDSHVRFANVGVAVFVEHVETGVGDERETSKGPLPRYYIQTRAHFRFRVVDDTTTISPDGLHFARVQRLDDQDPNDPTSADSLDALAYATHVMKLRRAVRGMLEGLDPARVRLLEEGYGAMPQDAAALSFWAAQWVPGSVQRKYELLECVEPWERVRRIVEALRL